MKKNLLVILLFITLAALVAVIIESATRISIIERKLDDMTQGDKPDVPMNIRVP